ncbi:MAG: hypothetical protein EKK36_02545 [Bradyrhizobiaceae bacterium]|jgi:hypothetical protein|uniref:hypothetical protein n=1 Tax=Afipia sp. 1NLS2 TaxID=666684 RepID=UPI0001DA04C6|nr:hypothetical protein [Afipia sp. 1NLS2]EFI50142.1 hypothetical protein AfiDRAFT_3281 [Afipia sp. 1NLS2]MBE0703082.1 hypothetical protein [Afipia sp.]RTL77278.1 MAG: hypothetical protein EKK36_02545 [Bradyrhizobiaceae bacterium]
MKALSATVALLVLGSSVAYAEKKPLRPKQECIDLAHARGFDRSQGQHGTANGGMNKFIHDCRRGLVK